MKKLISILLALTLLCSMSVFFVGCDKGVQDPESEQVQGDKGEKEDKGDSDATIPAENQVVEDQVAEEPAVEEPVVEEPAVEEPVVEEPVVEEPVVEEPVVEEPVVEEPAVEEPVVEEPAVEEPVVEEPVVEEPVVEEPVVEEPVVEEPVVEEPVVEEPVVEEPVVEEPVVEEPVVEDQTVEDQTPDNNTVSTDSEESDLNVAAYKGKVVSIMGDSISTFSGYIPVDDGFNLKHYTRYPQNNLFTEVEHTWWMQVITALDAKLGINDSWRSTEVYNSIDEEVNSSYDGTKACMASTTRIQNLGSNGTPDIILFYGGTNDISKRRPLGTFDPGEVPVKVDLASVKWKTVADAYLAAIARMKYYYPDTHIVALLPNCTGGNKNDVVEEYNSVFAAICDFYDVPYVDLRDCGITVANLPDGTHPDKEGMDYITDAVLEVLLDRCEVAPGENIVYSVTHELAGAKSSKSYYKGVSHGKSFTTEITGENLNVSVTMGGADITSDCYADGVVSIENVTGDIVISAKNN